MNYQTRRWQLLRLRVLKRDQYLCQESLRFGKRVPAEMVHHCLPADQYPQYAYCEWNLIALSFKAHEKMHVRDTRELTTIGQRWAERAKMKKLPHL